MSARYGSRQVEIEPEPVQRRPTRSAAAQTSWHEGQQRPPVEMGPTSRCQGLPAPMIINRREQQRMNHAPRGQRRHAPIGFGDTRRPRPSRGSQHQRAIDGKRAADVRRPADAAADSNASCAPSQSARARSAAPAERHRRVGNERTGTRAAETRPAMRRAITPPMPNAAARNPSGTAPDVAEEYPRRRAD